MSWNAHEQFHETWLGMVQPIDGLVLSIPVLVDAQCMERHDAGLQQQFAELLEEVDGGAVRIRDVPELFETLLDLRREDFDDENALPDALSLFVPEGHQALRPTTALRHQGTEKPGNATEEDRAPRPDHEATPASLAGERYAALVWQLPDDLSLDKPETVTGEWEYPPSAKFDRLLRHCRVPIGLLTNREVVRLVYAPHGESSGSITFRVRDMAETGGRPILDAFKMLLHARRWFGVAEEHTLPGLLRESRLRQADVTNTLADQVFEALNILLRGFEAADERDGRRLLHAALDADERGSDHVYGGLLTVLLRLVFVLYCEDRGLLPVDSDYYAEHLSVLGLFDRLREDHGAHPDSMGERFGAWAQLVALFRTIFLGARHGDLVLPARKGDLFDPHRFPFLEGWGIAGSAPITMAEHRADVQVPLVDDGTVFEVLDRLLMLNGQRLSYRALDVEQIGSVYEALMGYHVVRVQNPAVCLRPKRVWVSVEECADQSKAQLPKWLQAHARLQRSDAGKLATDFLAAEGDGEDDLREARLQVLESRAVKKTERARPGQLVLQPGPERRRTSSHYTPRSLSEPIVKRMLEPLIRAMGDEPSSEALLDLKICDPAMGSGAFLVETCRVLADLVVAAWTREGQLDKVASVHEDVVNHARRLVAQRCLYGVDKNPFAVQLAKLSLWLLTMARHLPFTFVDHALKHGDSLVGLSLEQIEQFRWEAKKKRENTFAEVATRDAIGEALELRQRILELAADGSEQAQREKELLLDEAEHALERLRVIGDLIVGAFFAEAKPKAREAERQKREDMVWNWLSSDSVRPPEVDALRDELWQTQVPFHWAIEFPEVFHAERVDPLDVSGSDQPAGLDGFVGNPPFAGKNAISEFGGDRYLPWLQMLHPGAHGNADYSAHFFRRAATLLGDHGTVALIATNTIAQGDTRATGLQALVADGFEIYDAVRSMTWPGGAAVTIATVHLAKGTPAQVDLVKRLDGQPRSDINSRLRPKPERPDPQALLENAGLSFQGSTVLGMGFVLTLEEREALIAEDSRNADRIFPYLGGEEVNTSPSQSHRRYVINFGAMSLEDAERWPDLLAIVRDKVKPERDRATHSTASWWHFERPRSELYAALAPLSRCLVNARHSKHLAFAFRPVDCVFSEAMVVYPLTTWSSFAVLQSRIHEVWARLLSSSMKTDLRYSPTDCFENFPFPNSDPRSSIASLEEAGESLYAARANLMQSREHGLTATYNQLKDTNCADEAIVALRQAHLDLDRAVLDAYGWVRVEAPRYEEPCTPAERDALEAFQDEVIDRLFALNAERART